ncbi:MAG TPA: MBL fold metallo-hydrolase [Candidatus Dormibacteraeota bacterium]|jgi:glyoxylase-like metal-dependent hydrolase (beta-lactamase superfamily II)|nr:MBL fold metallo-hydrolase [Candidatus Dormibacteraeota bacterium]
MELIAPGIRQLDTMMGGWDQVTAGFLVEGPQPALVETGARTSVATVCDALAAAGLGPADLRWLVLTHIHLDHAGGIGDLAEAFPSATVVVHERGARHLADPTRLIDSAARVYGNLLDSLYGRMQPVPQDRLVAAADGYRIDIGDGRFLTLVDSPGHAKHHHAVLDEHTGTLLVGDAVGVRLPDVGILRPAVPPPDFDLEQAVASLHRFAALRPTQVVLTHYGPVPDPLATLAEAEDILHQWVDVAAQVMRDSEDAGIDGIAAALAERFAEPPERATPAAVEKLEVLNGFHSNAAGIQRYLKLRRDAAE